MLVRDKPEFPPSLSSMEKSKETNFCMALKDVLKIPNYVRLVCIFSLMQGGFLAFGTNIDQLFAPIGFSNT